MSPEVRHALNHPVRRRILRVLSDSRAARSPAAVATLIHPNPGVSVVSYHLGVLDQLGCVRLLRAAGQAAPLCESSVEGDEEITSILQATRQLDRSLD
ncbi:MAG: hypothetical protein ACOYD4_17090 [Solirubrobacterales bacterium]